MMYTVYRLGFEQEKPPFFRAIMTPVSQLNAESPEDALLSAKRLKITGMPSPIVGLTPHNESLAQ